MAKVTATILTIIPATMAAVAGSDDGGDCGSNGNVATMMLMTAISTGWQQGRP